jgi:hypothetical protein
MKKPRLTSADRRTTEAILRTDFASFCRKVLQTLSPGTTYYDNWHIHAMTHALDSGAGRPND